MRKFIFIFLVLLFVVSNAFASGTRTWSLGGSNLFIKDDANIWFSPATILEYPNQGIVELGVVPGPSNPMAWGFTPNMVPDRGLTNSAAGGLHYGLFGGKNMVLGMYFGKSATNLQYATGNIKNATQKIDLLFGTNLGALGLGINLHLAGTSEETKSIAPPNTTPAEVKISSSASVFGVRIGTSLKIADASIGFFIPRFTDKGVPADNSAPGGDKELNKSKGSHLDIIARGKLEMDKKTTLVPVLAFIMESEGYESVPYPSNANKVTVDDNTTTILLGAGLNLTPKEETLINFDAGISIISMSKTTKNTVGAPSEIKSDDSDNSIPFFQAGMEVPIKDWIKFRAGYYKEWETVTDKGNVTTPATGSTTTTNKDAPFNASLGFGLKFGDLKSDVLVNPMFFFNGPYFVSGAPTNPMFGKVTFTYNW